jgi:hypothetical protein
MPAVEEYRAWVDQNLLRARVAQTEAERSFYVDLARTYLREVLRLDSPRSLPPTASLPHDASKFDP